MANYNNNSERPNTGNEFVDKLYRGNIRSNQNYNPKTGKGASEFIYDDSIGDPHSGPAQGFISTFFSHQPVLWAGKDEKERGSIQLALNKGINVLNPYNSVEENNKLKASRQSTAQKWGNAFMRAAVGEIVIGSIKGVLDVYDGIKNSITGNSYDRTPLVATLEDLQNQIDDAYEIYRRDPEASWDILDAGWWLESAVSIATTLSLTLPAAGWMKAVSSVGKLVNRIPKLFKGGRLLSQSVSRGITAGAQFLRGAEKGEELYTGARKLNLLTQMANSETKIREGAQLVMNVGLQSTFSRAAENMQEARQVYDEVYENSLENLNNMPDEEFEKFLRLHPEFIGKDKKSIAKEISRVSANKTFANDWWMLLQDFMQFKALSSVFSTLKKGMTTSAQRIALKQAKQRLAGVSAEKIIKNNVLNRGKEVISHAVKHPWRSIQVLELSEGFEEFFQGVQQDRGLTKAATYFDTNATYRTMTDYVRDPSLWEQGFWGALGGITFGLLYRGAGAGISKGKSFYKLKTGVYNNEQYEAATMGQDHMVIAQLNGFQARMEVFKNRIQNLRDGKNPFSYQRDPVTNRKIYNDDGSIKYEELDQNQKIALINDAIDELVVAEAMNSVDSGTVNVLRELLTSNELEQYLKRNGVNLTSSDGTLAHLISERMETLADLYTTELQKVNDVASEINPFVNRMVARTIVQTNLEIQELERILGSISRERDDLLGKDKNTREDYDSYRKQTICDKVWKELNRLKREEDSITRQFKEGKIGKTARDMHVRDLNNQRRALMSYLDEVNGTNVLTRETERILKQELGTDFSREFDKIMKDFSKPLTELSGHKLPIGKMKENINSEATVQIEHVEKLSMLPKTEQEYRELYDEMAYSFDETAKNRLTGYVNQLKGFLESASSLEEFDARWKQFLDETGLKGEMKDAAQALKYGYWQQNANGTVSLTAEIKKRQLEEIYKTLRQQKSERINADKKNEKDTGLQTPDGISAEDAQKAGATEKQEKDDNKQKGEEAKQKDKEDKQKGKEDKQKDKEGKQEKEEQVDKAVKKEEVDAKKEQEQQLAISRMSKIRYEIKKSIQKSLEAGVNASDMRDAALADVMRFIENNMDKRFATLFASDASYFSKIYDSVIDELNAFKQRQEGKRVLYGGESTDLGKAVLDAGFGETIEDSEKSFNAETETADSNVEEAEKQRIKKVIEHFLDLYTSAIKSVPTNDGKHIINLDMLFRHLMRNSRRISDRQSQNEVEEFFKINNQPLDAGFIANIYNNLAKYIAQFGGEKFVFTGLDKRYKTLPDFDTFANALKENWAQSESNAKNVHMFPIRDSERSEDFADAVFFAARGIDAKGKPVKVDVQQSKSDGCLYVTVSYTNSKGEKKENVKIGFFRATTMSETNDKYIPAGKFYGLQNRMVLGKDGKYHLEYESLFMEMINQTTERGKILLHSLVDFYTKLTALREKYENSNDDVGYNKELNELMSDSELDNIINNSLIQELYQKDMLRDNPDASKRTNAMNAMNAIANIILYGQSFDTTSPVSQIVNNLSSNSADMNERFQQWTEKLEGNYRQGVEIQKAIEEGKVITPSVRVGYNTHLNTVEKGEPRTNIADTVLGPEDPGLNAPNCKLVYVKDRQFTDEDGNVLDGEATHGIEDYSFGIIIWDNNGVRYVAYLGEEVDLENGSYLKEAVREEVADMIRTQLQNIVGSNGITQDSHGITFDNLRKKMRQLFNLSHNNLFKFYSGPGQCDVFVDGAKDFINVKINDNGEAIPLFSFYKYGRNGVGENNAINMLCIDKDGNIERDANGKPKYVMINGVVDGKIMHIDKNHSKDEDCTDYYNRAIDRALQHLRLNKSTELFKKESHFKETKGNQSRVIVKIGDTTLTYKSGRQKGQPITYRSYKEMMIQNRAFTTNVKRGRSGNIVDATINYGNITLSTGVVDVQRQSVSDLCFSKERPRRSTVSMRELVRAADPTLESQAEVMERLGFAKTIHLDHQDVSENTPLMKTEIERKDGKVHTKIYITARGAAEMNNNGLSAIRLIVHENLHSQLAHIDPIRKQKILDDVEQVYNYIIGAGDVAGVIDTEEGISKLNEELRSAIKRVFDKVSSKYASNRNVGLEEFLVECMSQPAIAQWLNQIEWTGEGEANASNVKKKTVFQKILEFIMNLFGTDTNKNINDGSTLARLYSIVGQQDGTVIGNNVSPDTNLDQETKETSPNELSEDKETEPVIEEIDENEMPENLEAETETVSIDFDRTVSQIDASIALSNQTRNSLNREQASNRRFENVGNMATYISSYAYDFQNMIGEMINEGEIEYSCVI